jgi:hypothetical protein
VTAPDNNGKNTGTGKGRPPAATRFQAGNAGRPRGSRNRATALLDVLAEGDLEAIYSKIIGWAKRGNLAAAALILNHGGARAAWSSRRDRPADIGRYDAADALLASYGAS